MFLYIEIIRSNKTFSESFKTINNLLKRDLSNEDFKKIVMYRKQVMRNFYYREKIIKKGLKYQLN